MAVKTTYHHGDLRKKLLETALEIISEHGLEKISMRGLGQRIGVSRSAPYRHFADKNALLCAIAEEGYKKFTAVIKKINEQLSDDPLTRLKNAGVAYVEFAVSNPVHYRIMFGNEIIKNKRTQALTQAAHTLFNEFLHAVMMCQNEKIIISINPSIIANTLWSLTHGISTLLIDGQIQTENVLKGSPALLQSDIEPGKVDVQQIIESMNKILYTGLLADS